VRRNAADNSTSGVIPSTASMTEGQRNAQADRRSNKPLQVGVHLGAVRPTNQPESTSGGQPSEIPSRLGRSSQRTFFPDQPRSATPERQFDCDGWCKYTQAADSCQNVVSIKGRYRSAAAASCLFSGLYICLLGLSARMGRAQRLADHNPVQLP